MCNFAKKDVLALAAAITREPLDYYDGDFIPYFMCDYCSAKGYGVRRNDFKHDLDCPVLIAQDVLTRHTNSKEQPRRPKKDGGE